MMSTANPFGNTDAVSPKIAFLASANGVFAIELTPLLANDFEN